MKRMCLLVAISLFGACISKVKVEPVTVEPIHVTVDVNVHDDGVVTPKR